MGNEVILIRKDVEVLAANRDLYVHTYQTNLGRYSVSSSIGVHKEKGKPRNSDMCSEVVVGISQRLGIGKTKRSQEYRAWKEVRSDLIKNY